MDYKAAALRMVERQLAPRGIRDPRVLAAMRETPRHLFVGADRRDEAYDDAPLSIGEGQTISQPYMVAIMTELLDLKGSERVLEIGTGSGYQAAVLSRLCAWVYTIERIHSLSIRAKETIAECGYTNVSFFLGDGTEGLPEHSPYDAVIVTAGAPTVPETLVDQLVVGGRLVIPVGDRFTQTLTRITKTEAGTRIEEHIACRFVNLVGKYGW